MFQTHAEVHSDVRERRGKEREEEGERGSERRRDNARPIGSAFRPHDSEGSRKVQNENWAKG